MKKHFIFLIAIIAALSACKKDAVNSGKDGKGTVPVTFNVGFAQSTGAFNVTNKGIKLAAHALSSVDPVLAANASTLYIAIYQADGTRLYLTKQLSADTVFGKAQYNLPPGTYTVAFAAGQGGLFYSGSGLSNDYLVYSTTISSGNYDYTWHDTFFKKMTLVVTGSGINQSVTLERIDSQIIVDVEDAIPSNVKYIQVTASDTSFSQSESYLTTFDINTASPGGESGNVFSNSSLTSAITTGVKNTKFALIVLNSNKPYSIQISASDQIPGANFTPGSPIPGRQIAFASINNVAVQTAHQTILTGELFGGNGTTNTGGFQITLDPVWDPTTTTIPFQ